MRIIKGKVLGLSLAPSLGLILILSAYAQDNYKVDNTIQNRRDRDASTLTAQDQSNRRSDIKLTAKLRRAVVRETTLSMDAKNIKIIDKNGCVFLRGPVDSMREKQVIDNIAHQYCGANYKNELEVK